MVSQKDTVLHTPDAIGSLRLDLSDDGKARSASLRADVTAGIALNDAVGAALRKPGRDVHARAPPALGHGRRESGLSKKSLVFAAVAVMVAATQPAGHARRT
jgi:hypothetical protein